MRGHGCTATMRSPVGSTLTETKKQSQDPRKDPAGAPQLGGGRRVKSGGGAISHTFLVP